MTSGKETEWVYSKARNRHAVKVKVWTLDTAPLTAKTHLRSAQVWHALSRDLTVHMNYYAFIRKLNELYLSLPSLTKLVLMADPGRMEG